MATHAAMFQHEGQVSQEEACLEIMKAAYDGGVNFFDNAEGCEAIQARCLRRRQALEGGCKLHLNLNRGCFCLADGSGDAEELMGAAIALGIERGYWVREDLVITTKIFNGTPGRWTDGAKTMNR